MLEYILNFNFGVVSILFSVLCLGVSVLAVTNSIGCLLLKVCLAADDENAPNYTFIKNYVVEAAKKVFTKDETISFIEEFEGGYILKSEYNGKYHSSSFPQNTYTGRVNIRVSCMFKTKQEVEAYAKVNNLTTEYVGSGFKNLQLLALPFIADILLSAYFYSPFVTTLCLGVGVVVFSLRTICKKVYKNTKELSTHEERIEKLEGGA